MKIEQIELFHLAIPFIYPFKFSNGELSVHDCLIVAIQSESLTGWGECPAFTTPNYTYETITTAHHVLKDFLIPQILGKTIDHPQEAQNLWQGVRGHNMAKSALDCAIWDLFAQAKNISLAQLLGGVRPRVEVGVSVSLQSDLSQLLTRLANYISQGYQRVKLKIEPQSALQSLQAIRQEYPYLKLMVDANSAFTLDDIALFQAMDELDLLMIEQPLAYDDLLDHARLQSQIQTPICLDESINSVHDTRCAIALQSARVINLKVSRVGGITNALAIHDLCQQAGIKLWCGGMLESGIGRATNLHLASLPNFVLPGDISATNRYFHQDISEPEVILNAEDSTIDVPQGIGLGIEIKRKYFRNYQQSYENF